MHDPSEVYNKPENNVSGCIFSIAKFLFWSLITSIVIYAIKDIWTYAIETQLMTKINAFMHTETYAILLVSFAIGFIITILMHDN